MASNNHKHDPNVLHPHISPTSMYVKVAATLFALTVLTVVAHHFHEVLGVLAAPIAFLIAAIKATFVLLYFMHLKDDNNMNRVIFASGFFFLLVLLFFSAIDIWTRVVEVSPL
ncbi:MAG TPA: cytochrome C oxidase subunit IV family protein [Bdellovibrio sp.]|uniref:cytochrome C oxidase subunit IV family protein n=1 Tax=Bdellovibrio sp. TaxID=28201 RepID=UPI002F1EC188